MTILTSPSKIKLAVVIVGGGIGGLCTAVHLAREGHTVTVLEASPRVHEVGAGIQMAPNATRILTRLGLGSFLEENGVRPETIVFRHYNSGDIIGQHTLQDIEGHFGMPYRTVHRRDLAQKLFELAIESNVNVRFSSPVASVHPDSSEDKTHVRLESGEAVKADVIIGADGVHSATRQFLIASTNQHHALGKNRGEAAYRAVIPASELLADPELESLVRTPQVTFWVGPESHMVGYCIGSARNYNIVLAHRDSETNESWTLESSADAMRTQFKDWEPRVTKILKLVQSTYKWKLVDRDPLKQWYHPSGRLILMGDACHPMLPYRAQGAAMALEDAAVLGELFAHIRDEKDILKLAAGFQLLRSPRCDKAQLGSRRQKPTHDPSDQLSEGTSHIQFSRLMTSDADRKATFSYDAREQVQAWLKSQ